MKTTKKYATIFSKDGERIQTIETGGCELSYDPSIYEHIEHDAKDAGLKLAQKDPRFKWISLTPFDEDSGTERLIDVGHQKKPVMEIS